MPSAASASLYGALDRSYAVVLTWPGAVTLRRAFFRCFFICCLHLTEMEMTGCC